MKNDADIECIFINTVHSYILNDRWQVIANRLGEAVVRRVLTRPLFVRSVARIIPNRRLSNTPQERNRRTTLASSLTYCNL